MIQTRLAHFGNSRGIRIPKPLLLQAGIIEDDVTVEVRDNEIVIRKRDPVGRQPREGWEAEVARMIANGDAELVWPDDAIDDVEMPPW